ncbi:MAG: hypothetical protein WBA09_22200 [Candidatus Acidiferrum sp.]
MSEPEIIVTDSDWPTRTVKRYELRIPESWLVRARYPRLMLIWWLFKLAWRVRP